LIEASYAEINEQFTYPYIITAWDVNQLSDQELVERTGLQQVVDQPTRGINVHDRIYISDVQYNAVHITKSTVRIDHKAVIAYTGKGHHIRKTAARRNFIDTSLPHRMLNSCSSQHQWNLSVINQIGALRLPLTISIVLTVILLETCCPERFVSVTSRDPDYVTPDRKSKLRRKNRLTRAGRVEEAGALSKQIGKEIVRNSKSTLSV
jgi:hypothetical protein